MSAPASTQFIDGSAYERFYGFVQSPFTLAPDPRFLYLSGTHEEASTQILQAIRRREGFIVLAGDIGTGKTTLCRSLIGKLDAATFTSLILDPFVSVEELLRDVLLDFGVVSRESVRNGRLAAATKHELVSTLHDFLLSLVPLRGSAVLIIDEAQHLSAQVLEQIRILSNLESNEAKLLQIILVGQLSLLQTLAEAEMRQLDQRISLRIVLTPLSRAELNAYISHRLAIAKGTLAVTFDQSALDRVHEYTGGVPRVINLLCDRTLMLGAQAGLTELTSDTVDRAAQALALKKHTTRARAFRSLPRWAAVLLFLLMLLIVLALLVPIHRLVPTSQAAPPQAPALRGSSPAIAVPIPREASAPPVRVIPRPRPAPPDPDAGPVSSPAPAPDAAPAVETPAP